MVGGVAAARFLVDPYRDDPSEVIVVLRAGAAFGGVGAKARLVGRDRAALRVVVFFGNDGSAVKSEGLGLYDVASAIPLGQLRDGDAVVVVEAFGDVDRGGTACLAGADRGLGAKL